jgi:hypothetical protein
MSKDAARCARGYCQHYDVNHGILDACLGHCRICKCPAFVPRPTEKGGGE